MILIGTTFLGFKNHSFQTPSRSLPALTLPIVSRQHELVLQKITASKKLIPMLACECIGVCGKEERLRISDLM